MKFKKWSCDLSFGEYSNGRFAIQLVSSFKKELVAVATVNLPDEIIQDDEVIIKNYSENEGILDFLIKEKVVGPSIRRIKTGFVNADVCKLLYDRNIIDLDIRIRMLSRALPLDDFYSITFRSSGAIAVQGDYDRLSNKFDMSMFKVYDTSNTRIYTANVGDMHVTITREINDSAKK